ncbi:helix-turn-helix transcriptional regulator [Streptomyces sp. TS71-3]|nr:helix-turn-helix transcriptional regulator [Streptomyces sp. TS71-3]
MVHDPASGDVSEREGADRRKVPEGLFLFRPPVPLIRVAVCEGDPLARAGVTGYLARRYDMTVVQWSGRGSVGVAAGADVDVDVAVVLVDAFDSAACVRLRKLVVNSRARVVLVVDGLDERQLELVLEAGVRGIVWRRQATEVQLAQAIRAAWRDESDIPDDLLRRLMAQRAGRARGVEVGTVVAGRPTPRELRVLELVAHGLSTKEIADRLSYSERTVKGNLHDVMTRLNLRNRAHAVAYAIREGYI